MSRLIDRPLQFLFYSTSFCPVCCYTYRIYEQKELKFAIHGYTNPEQRIHIMALKTLSNDYVIDLPIIRPYPITTIFINKHIY